MTLLKTLLLWLFLWPVLIFYYPLRWLWKRLFRRAKPIVPPGTYWVDVVGESHYYDNFIELFGDHGRGVDEETFASLITEDDNAHDPGNAVRVEIGGLTVGYLPRKSATVVRKMFRKLKTGEITEVPASVRGGWSDDDGDHDFGVRLML